VRLLAWLFGCSIPSLRVCFELQQPFFFYFPTFRLTPIFGRPPFPALLLCLIPNKKLESVNASVVIFSLSQSLKYSGATQPVEKRKEDKIRCVVVAEKRSPSSQHSVMDLFPGSFLVHPFWFVKKLMEEQMVVAIKMHSQTKNLSQFFFLGLLFLCQQ